ncbi:MAG TPA: ABC transporter permease [Blastocatellia bacterium]|nr:ABC transporter permease [Blastocatellia bacterium]
MLQDCKSAIRMAFKNLGFTVLVALTLGLGIGACTAIFTVIDKILIEPLPYKDASKLVLLHSERRTNELSTFPMSLPDFLDYRTQSSSFDYLSAISGAGMNFSGGAQPVRIEGARVSSDFFPMLGVSALAGKVFDRADESPGAGHVIVVSFGFWSNTLGADGSIIGRRVLLDGEGYDVIGVLPKEFQPPFARADIWLPFSTDVSKTSRDTRYIRVMGRLKPDVGVDAAQAEMNSIAELLEKDYPRTNRDVGVKLTRLSDYLVKNARTSIPFLLAAVGLVLLISCADVANLLLARAGARRKEILIRNALGASRWRIVRQLLVESLLLSVAGAGIGLLLGRWGTGLLAAAIPSSFRDFLPGLNDLSLDWRVLIATALLAGLASLVFGLAPALRASRPGLVTLVRDSGMVSDRGSRRLGGLLVIGEITLALVLLATAGLMLKSVYRLVGGDQGFDPSGLLTMRLSLPTSKYPDAGRVKNFVSELLENTKSIPQLKGAAVISEIPFSDTSSSTSFAIEDRPAQSMSDLPILKFHRASSQFFDVFGLPVLEGRNFSQSDEEDSAQLVVIVNKRMADLLWKDQSALGKRIRFDNPNAPWWSVEGVVANVKHAGPDNDEEPEVYFPYGRVPQRSVFLVVRTASDPAGVTSAIRDVVSRQDPDLPLYDVRTMDQAILEWTTPQRLTGWLLGVFAAIALALVAMGVYGVMSYSVTQRTKEIGLQMALGAGRGTVLRGVLNRGAVITLIGMGAGTALALLAARLMSAILYDVEPYDPLVFGMVLLLVAAVSLVAILVPALRATRVDPMEALRQE